ncbi:HEAT repeat domain-containing protein [Roseofilum casamattae]|uniref:HEAT repeat domain-containing protein n=1 Tax=Roseofilum casamattae BLCC-M143 TaxID=3022442 RepID=A0ABT7BUN3_9CYAN|nr:HEAT repeat domain-containing protein [Roseofilum casamattae]MDJ1182898.1 HEAT repeat domain-containing protein [Roseofilum casamattae BLCC-M143]
MNALSSSEFAGSGLKSPLSHEETDAFLQKVQPQVMDGTFNSGDRKVLKQTIECLGDTRGMTRLAFAETLGLVGLPASPLLQDALRHHPNVVVRRASAKTLTLIGDPTAVPTLVEAMLNDEDMVVKGSSVGALARTGEVAVPALLDILSNPDHPENYKGLVSWALVFIGAEAKDLVYEQMTSELPEVRAMVIEVMMQVARENPDNCDREIELLLESLGDPVSIVRCEGITALGNLKYVPGIPNVLQLLHHEDMETRKTAAIALMKIGEVSSIDPLETALNQEPEVAVGQVIKLAINTLQNASEEEDDWDDED